MAKDVYKQNEEFLKSKGIVLKATGAMFSPYDFENDDYSMGLSEYCYLDIRNKKTGKNHSVNMAMQLLDESDLS